MNSSTALARALVEQLLDAGVREAVLSPGSRSAPLAFALQRADAARRLRLHVRVDERSAGFLALGLAKASGRPSLVACTSGTAAANLYPAVLEAHHSGVAVVVVTADRPPQLRQVAANQTTDQPGMFGRSVRMDLDLASPPAHVERDLYWRSAVARAVLAATGAVSGDPGPVHVNVAFAEPLVPDEERPDDGDRPAGEAVLPDAAGWPAAGGADVAPVTPARILGTPVVLERSVPTVVVAGDGAGARARLLAEDAGWPLLAEPSSGAWGGSAGVPAAAFVAAAATSRPGRLPARVVVAGHPTLARPVLRLLDSARVDVIVLGRGLRWPDPTRRARVVATDIALVGSADPRWQASWRAAGDRAHRAVSLVLDAAAGTPEPRLARDVLAAIPADSTVFVASSQPVRDVYLAAHPRHDVHVLANRGLSGIDGIVSSAVGAALAGAGPAYALVGDLAFVHDLNGLVIGPGEPRPDLTVVVVDNGGGGIFGLLEQGDPRFRGVFERLFATPPGVEIDSLCAGVGAEYAALPDAAARGDIDAALARPAGLRVVHARTDRTAARVLHEELRQAAADAIGDFG